MKPASQISIWDKLTKLPFFLSHWSGLIGLLAVAVNFFLQPDDFINPWTILTTALNLICLIAVPCFPLLTWMGYLVLFLLLSTQPDIRATACILFAPLVSASVADRNHSVAAVAGIVLLWYSGSINPSDGILLPPDLLASSIWAVLLAVAVLVGHILQRIITQRRDLIEQWNNDVRTRRETWARVLHDSVATSLTSVVVRAETLSLQQGIAIDMQAELAAIADQARDSMKEVRGLLHLLSDDHQHRSSDSEASAPEQINQMTRFLRAHGFTVETTGPIYALSLDADRLVILREILAETAANIIKYAEPRSLVQLTVEDRGSHVTISLINTICNKPHTSHLSTGLGLPAILQLAESVGGSIRTVSSSTRWNTELRMPQ